MSPEAFDTRSEQAQITPQTENAVSHEPAPPEKTLTSRNSITQPFSASTIASKTTQTFSDTESETPSQRQSATKNKGQDNSSMMATLDLDPALQEERYSSAETVYEREQMILQQEAIMAMEEETNLYQLPPEGEVLSAEEQDKIEQESVTASSANPDEDIAFELQQTLDEEARINEIYGDQGELLEESNGE